MKKICILVAIVISSIFLAYAQSNNGISYQGYFSNYEFSGEQTLRITLLKDSGHGQVIYMEETVASVENGRFSIVIGHGQAQGSNNFMTIEWGSYNAIFCKIEWVRSFSNVRLLSLSQLMSVPFAFHAQKADSVLYAKNAFYAERAGRMIDTIIIINNLTNNSWPLHIDIPQMDFMPSKMHLEYVYDFPRTDIETSLAGRLKYYDLNSDGNAIILDRFATLEFIERFAPEGRGRHRDSYNYHFFPTTKKILYEDSWLDESDRLRKDEILFNVSPGQFVITNFLPSDEGYYINLKLFLIAEN